MSRDRATRLRFAHSLAAVVLLASTVVVRPLAADDTEKLLPRSFYLPIELEVCDHLHDAVLRLDGRPVSLLPTKRIFQFTFYPTLDRVEPVRTDIEVVGTREDGERFLAKLAVTPWGVFTADTKIELDMDEQLARMRYKIDVRYEPMPLRLRCSDSCRKSGTVTEEAAVEVARGETGADTIRE